MMYACRIALEQGRNILIGAVVLVAHLLVAKWCRSADGDVERLFSAGLYAFSILVCAMWVVFCAHRQFRKWCVRISLFVMLFVWGGAMYFCSPPDDLRQGAGFEERSLDSVLRAIGAFLPGRGSFETFSGDRSRVSYYAFHSCVALYLGMWFFSLVGSSFVNRLRRWWTCDKRLHVFWGTSRQGMLLAGDIVRTSVWRQVEFNFPVEAFADHVERERLTDVADKFRGIWLFLDYGRFGMEAARGAYHYFLGDDAKENIRLANRLIECMRLSNGGKREKTFYLRLESSHDEKVFVEWAKWAREQGVNPVVIRENEMIARQFACDHSPLRDPKTKIDTASARVVSGVSTLLVGFDGTGVELFNQLMCASQFAGMDGGVVPFPVTVVDQDGERWHKYVESAPEIAQEQCGYPVDFKCMDPAGERFSSFLRSSRAQFDRIIICATGDDEAIRQVLFVTGVLKELDDVQTRVFVKICDADVYGGIISRLRRVTCFGDLAELYTMRFFDNSALDCMAKRLNWVWAGGQGSSGGSGSEHNAIELLWREADYYKRQASRASALGELNLLYLLGYERRAAGALAAPGSGSLEYQVDSAWLSNKELSDARLDVLAENEHLRWNAYQRTHGVRRWDMERPLPIEDVSVSKKANQIERFGRHAALVDFKDLSAVDLRIELAKGSRCANGAPLKAEDFDADEIALSTISGPVKRTTLKGYDRDFCRGIFSNAIEAGLMIYKLYGKTPEQVLEEGRLAENVYGRFAAALPTGFTPYSGFLTELDVHPACDGGLIAMSLGKFVSTPGFIKVRQRRLARCEYLFNPQNGMISPNPADAKDADLSVRLTPHFVAQVLECDGRIVVVFGGTASFRDWQENLTQLRGITPPQFKLASRLVNAIARSTDLPIHMIGHSEGGGEVQYCYLKNFASLGARLTGSTFNSQRLSAHLLERMDDDAKRSATLNIVHYRIANDIVSGLRSLGNDLQGMVFNLGRAGGILFPFAFRLAHNLKSVQKSFESPSRKGHRRSTIA